ncbi:MAG: DUF6095 family protein [Flavobacteriaceae bacterium]
MRTNKEILSKGIKYMAFALFFMFSGPFLLHLGFKLRNFLTIGIAGLFCIAAILLTMKGLHTILKALFND